MSSDAQRAALPAAPVIARSGTMPGAADLAAGAGIPPRGAPARASMSDGAAGTVKRAGSGRRRTQPQVNEEAVARKYVHLSWPVGRCAREYHVSPARIRAILAARGVELRPAAAPLDPDAVLAAFARHGSVRYVASALGADEHRVRALLDQQGVPRSGPLTVADLSAATRVAAGHARRQRPVADLSPVDLLWPYQAARMLDVSPDFLKAATAAGQIPQASSRGGQRRYLRRDIEEFARRLRDGTAGTPPPGAPGSTGRCP